MKARLPLTLLLLCLGAMGCAVLVELLFRPPATSLSWWLHTAPRGLLADSLLVAVTCFTLLALTARPLTALLLTLSLLLLLSLAHASTLATLGRPLYPWDVLLFRQAVELWPYLSQTQHLWLWALLTAALLAALVASLVRGPRMRWKHSAMVGAAVLPVWLWFLPQPAHALRPLGVRHRHWEQRDNYLHNGLPLAFLMNLPAARVTPPEGLSDEALARALTRGTARDAGDVKPDVVVVMSESFFDVTTLPGVKFEEDPLPNFHRLQREHAHGRLVVPSFGGGTANTEFEFLTGHSMRFLPRGSVPYQQYVRGPVPSLPSHLVAQGYSARAVHIYHRWFWERDAVYRHLGFQHFFAQDNLPSPPQRAYYPGDALMTQQLIAELAAATQPLLLFGVSVEAHGPYEKNRYEGAPLGFDGPLDEPARAELHTYARAIHEADAQLGRLLEFLEARERPCVLVFFGDHLPSLPHTMKALRLLDAPWNLHALPLDRRAWFYEVPLLVWNNAQPQQRDLGRLSTTFLAPLVLREAGLQGTPYFDFLDALSREWPVVSPDFLFDAHGALLADEPPAFADAARDWWLLEYSALFVTRPEVSAAAMPAAAQPDHRR